MTTSIPIPILYEDEHVVVINKPAWSVVHRTRGAKGALIILEELSRQLGQTLYPIHRLDRQTSGVLLLAKSSTAANTLSEELRESRVRKIYLGLCRGVIDESCRVDSPVPEEGTKRSARTDFDPVEVFCERYTLVRAFPRTGRHHQIRYHLRHLGHPLACDVKYGNGAINRFFRSTLGLDRMFLHAEHLRIIHPVELRYLKVSCPLPPDLEAVLEKLRRYEGPVA